MKKRTIIFSILIVLSVLIVLSGCDAILEAIYPDYGDKAAGGGNEIIVNVDIDPSLADWDVQISGKVESANSGPDDPDYFTMDQQVPVDFNSYDPQGNPIPKAFFDFWGIPGDQDRPRQYRVTIWIDRNGNGFPDFDEPQAIATWENYDINDPSNTWPDDMFYFPNDQQWSSISGNAFLGNQVKNLNFSIVNDADFVIGTNPQTYQIKPDDPDQIIAGIYWELSSDLEYYSGDVPPTDIYGDNADLIMDYSGKANGDYRLDVNVNYADGSFWHRYFTVRIGTEAADTIPYNLNIDLGSLWQFGFVDGNSYNVEVQGYYYDSTWTRQDDPSLYYSGPYIVNTGEISININAIPYNASNLNSTNAQDWVEVTLDTNDNGITGDAGDFRIEMPVSLLSGEVSYSMYLDAMDFYPLMP